MAQPAQAQPEVPAQQAATPAAAAAPAASTIMDKLQGTVPTIFNGDCRESQTFLHQFNMFWGMNETHPIMTVPYFRTMYALLLMKGQHVNDWVNDQVDDLRTKTMRQQNPIRRDNPILWNDFSAAFVTAFTDTAQKQNAYQKLRELKMYKDNLDTYISTFNNLAKKAEYTHNQEATANFFGEELNKSLLTSILNRDAQPVTLQEWEEAARTEQRKHARKQAMLYPHKHQYRWEMPRCNGTSRRHPNDKTVPMDVDIPIFIQVSRAYTEEDKTRYCAQGRCFRCDKQGHMANQCPERKVQEAFHKPKPHFNLKSQFKRKSQGQSKHSFHKSKTQRHHHGYTLQARIASIEEIPSDSNNNDDKYDQSDNNEAASLAARVVKLGDDQKEEWVKEMCRIGIHF